MSKTNTSAESWDVIVVGAGPSGLAAANLLAHAGIRTLLVERERGTVKEPRAVSIDDESLRTMQAAGIVDDVVKDIALDYGSHFVGPGYKLIYKVEPTTREYGYPRRSAVVQPLLEQTQLDGFIRHKCATALLGWSCLSANENASGVTLSLESDEGKSKEVHAKYVVAGDGAASQLRDIIGANLDGATYDQRWLIVDIEGTKDRYRQSFGIADPKRPAVNIPGADGRRRFEFMLFPHEKTEDVTQEAFVRELISNYGPDKEAEITRRQVYRFHARVADKWQSERIFLVGDAAHLSPPFAGQGMNSGIRDAHNISWKLISVLRGDIGAELLKTYESERKPHAQALIDLAVRNGGLLVPPNALMGKLQRWGYRVANKLPSVQNHFQQMKNKPKGHYVDGFVIPSEGLTGRLAPQPRLERLDRTTILLDDMVGNDFALLVLGRNSQEAAQDLSKLDWGLKNLKHIAITPWDYNLDRRIWTQTSGRDVDNLICDSQSDQTRVLLMRPDRYVAMDAILANNTQELAASVKSLVMSFHRKQENNEE